MIDQHGNYVCDYCTSINGEFYDETGNHVGCQDVARKNAVELAALREAVEALQALVGHCDRNFYRDTHITKEPEPMKKARAALAKLEGAK
jgi:predicted house-cleaning NTP pyrophosphatase (Maf/HAM1 superfamily)